MTIYQEEMQRKAQNYGCTTEYSEEDQLLCIGYQGVYLTDITAEQLDNMQDFQKLNVLAEQPPYPSPIDQMKFKAALAAEEPKDMDGIRDIFDNLEQYELDAYADGDDDFFKDYLDHHLGSHFDRAWLDTVLLKTEASKLL